jgi:hypothetical protein
VPKIRRANLPEAVLRHLLARIREREFTAEALAALAAWLDTNPEVPKGRWFHRMQHPTVCGEGELVLTFLRPG